MRSPSPLSISQHSEQSERTGVPSGSLDHWRQGVLLQLEPAPVLEIVITVPARPLQHHLTPAQPHHGALQPAPLTINNHHPASPSHSSSTTIATTATTVTSPQPQTENVLETLAEFLHITKKWHEVLYFTARNPKEVGERYHETSQKLYGLHCCLQNFISILRNWKGQKCGI